MVWSRKTEYVLFSTNSCVTSLFFRANLVGNGIPASTWNRGPLQAPNMFEAAPKVGFLRMVLDGPAASPERGFDSAVARFIRLERPAVTAKRTTPPPRTHTGDACNACIMNGTQVFQFLLFRHIELKRRGTDIPVLCTCVEETPNRRWTGAIMFTVSIFAILILFAAMGLDFTFGFGWLPGNS